MKTTKWICATSCAALLAMSACDNQFWEEGSAGEKGKIPVELKSPLQFDPYTHLDFLAMSLSSTISLEPSIAELIAEKFAETGQQHLLIQDLLGWENNSDIAMIWDGCADGALFDICSEYPNLRVSIEQEAEEVLEILNSDEPNIIIGYKFVSTSDNRNIDGYNQMEHCIVDDIYTDNTILFTIEGGTAYSDEEILENIHFIGQPGYADNDDGWVDIVKIQGGKRRKDGGCNEGFGVCHLWLLGWQVWDQIPIDEDYRTICIGFNEPLDLVEQGYIALKLAEPSNIDISDVWIPICENIVIPDLRDDASDNTMWKIPYQQSIFDPEVGDYGGFRLLIEPIN